MRARVISALAAGALCVIYPASTAAAQRSDSSRYEGQALRYESYWGSARIIRGADGPLVGTAGWFRSFDVEKLVAASPPARAEARVYKSNSFRASVIGIVGATATVVGVVVVANGSNNASSPVLIIGGVGAMVWGAERFHTAFSALSRSLWWYNRDLVRSSSFPSPAPVAVPTREGEQGKRNQHPE
ncbi:MAG TPA: hypothetical protein VGO75_08845 [Gemmatimonadaceae bacterium]|nr:hypothetical protein [Gemmatimonadaceae bacterium]